MTNPYKPPRPKSTPKSLSPWLVHIGSPDHARVRLFCFHYAGGSASVFYPWRLCPSAGVDLYGIELPGRGARLAEPAFRRMNDLIPVLADALKPHLLEPFVFFGHSLGAAVGYELLKELERRGQPPPDQLYVSGRRAPQLASRRPIGNVLSDAEFIEELRRLGGTPAAVLSNRELMAVFLPTLRADFEVSETYLTTDDSKIETPVFAFTGSDDIDTTLADVNAWSHKTHNFGGTVVLSGGHFFLHAHCDRILQEIACQLQTKQK